MGVPHNTPLKDLTGLGETVESLGYGRSTEVAAKDGGTGEGGVMIAGGPQRTEIVGRQLEFVRTLRLRKCR